MRNLVLNKQAGTININKQREEFKNIWRIKIRLLPLYLELYDNTSSYMRQRIEGLEKL